MSEQEEKPRVSELTRTILESGLVDEGMASLMERWGYLPEGATNYVNNEALTGATKKELLKLAEKIGNAAEKANSLRETRIDFDRMRWPISVSILRGYNFKSQLKDFIVRRSFNVLVDRMDRFYFRAQEVKEEWFVPGDTYLEWPDFNEENQIRVAHQVVLQSQFLYAGEQKVAFQVSCGEKEDGWEAVK